MAHRIGIVLTDMPKVNKSVLMYLVLQMNTLQGTFEFEFVPMDLENDVIKKLNIQGIIDRDMLRNQSFDCTKQFQLYLEGMITRYNLLEAPPDKFIILTLSKFSDNYYVMSKGKLAVIALGEWDKVMAPPTIYEFFITLILRSAIGLVSPSLINSMHLGCKGCMFDFTYMLDEVRYKTLSAFICEHCRARLIKDGFSNLLGELVIILRKDWLGKPNIPNTPANIVKKMGYNLFTMNDLAPTKWQLFLEFIQQEGIKQLINIIGGLILAALILGFGLN